MTSLLVIVDSFPSADRSEGEKSPFELSCVILPATGWKYMTSRECCDDTKHLLLLLILAMEAPPPIPFGLLPFGSAADYIPVDTCGSSRTFGRSTLFKTHTSPCSVCSHQLPKSSSVILLAVDFSFLFCLQVLPFTSIKNVAQVGSHWSLLKPSACFPLTFSFAFHDCFP